MRFRLKLKKLQNFRFVLIEMMTVSDRRLCRCCLVYPLEL